eukprot:g5058.t1
MTFRLVQARDRLTLAGSGKHVEPIATSREQWETPKPGWSQRGAAVNLPGGRWTNDAQVRPDLRGGA